MTLAVRLPSEVMMTEAAARLHDPSADVIPIWRWYNRRYRFILPKFTREAEMTTRLQSEHIDEGLSRRGLVQALDGS
jgi:hypothetical protein